ncbi:MAG: acyltransferase domain-containing protein [Caldilineaceae bacterium]
MSVPIFLSQQTIFENAAYAVLEPTKAQELARFANWVADSELLRLSAEKLHLETFSSSPEWGKTFPADAFAEELNKLYLLIALDAIRQLRTIHTERGIPEAVTRYTATTLSNSARRYAEYNSGKLGLEDWVLRYWFNVVASGNLYRLGRMEFIWEPFEPAIRVYRHRQTGQVQALAEEGVNFTDEGYQPFAIREEEIRHYGWSLDEREVWTTRLLTNEIQVTGTPISPLGYALRQEITLFLADWELIFRQGDSVLEMHIPNYAPLTLDLLKDSFAQALNFFPRYHPERPFRAFSCNSWIFNTQWVDMLPPTSNVLAFQRQGYLFPIPSDGLEGTYFLFGTWLIDLDKAPQDTTLRRSVIQHFKRGGKLRTGGFFLLPNEVAKFGEEPYQKFPSNPQQ